MKGVERKAQKMTREEYIKYGLERFSTCKTTDLMNFDWADVLNYIRQLETENAELKTKINDKKKQMTEYDTKAMILDIIYDIDYTCNCIKNCINCKYNIHSADCKRRAYADALVTRGMRFIEK